MESVPIDVLFRVFHYLTFVELFKVERTCKDFRDVVHTTLWKWKYLKKPHTEFKRVEFVSGMCGINSFTIFIDLRLLKIHKGMGDLLFKHIVITHCFPNWIPKKFAVNYFNVFAIKIKWKSEAIFVDFFRTWDFNGNLYCYNEESISLRSVMNDFNKRIQFVDSLVVERE